MDSYQIVVGNNDCPLKTVVSIVRRSPVILEKWSTFARQLDVSSEQIKRLRHDYLLLSKVTFEDLLYEVLEIWVGKNGSKATLVNLLQVVEGHCEANDVGELLRLEYKLPCKEAKDNPSIDWNDLSPAFQKRVMKTFQHFTPNLKFSKVLPKLGGAALVSLMRGKKPHVLSLPEELSYYVSRTIVTRSIISESIFDRNTSDIFLFVGMDRYDLSKLAKDKLTGNSRQQLQNGVNVKFIILDQESHFERICWKTNHPVHLLRREGDGKLKWLKSNGRMDNLWMYIDQKQDELDEGEFCQICTTKVLPVLICDTPGMGKSVLMAQMGHTLVQLHPERTILFIVLSKFIEFAKSLKIEDKLKVTELTLKNWTGEVLHQSKSDLDEKTVLIELLLDGYDEVDPADRKLALELLQTIGKSFKSIRLWVTSRPHLMDDLENTLNVLGYNIRPFHEENQVKFLSSFWSRKLKLHQEKVKLFAKQCLQSLKATMKSTDNDIAGIPLQCLLIGEVYEDDAMEYAKLGAETVSSEGHGFEIEIGTITSLYRQLVKLKFEKYQSAFRQTKFSKNDLMTIHAHLSLELLFPFEHGILRLTKESEIDIDEVMKAGILTSTPMGEVTFLHRTFAEYFVAWFILDKLQQEEKWEPKLVDLLFGVLEGLKFQNTIKFAHPVICYFLNSIIPNLQIANFSNNFPEFDERYLPDINMILGACVEGNFVQIFKLFDQHGAFDKLSGNVFNDGILLASVTSSVELMKSILTHFERHHSFDLKVQKAILREAVRQGKFSILEFLIKEKQLRGIVENWEETTNLVCDCVEGTMGFSDEEIKETILVLRMLVGIKGSLMDGLNGSSTTAPLLSNMVHVKLLIELVRLGANLLAQNGEGDTLLHLSCFCRYNNSYYTSSEAYHKLVMSISTDNLKELVHIENTFQETALMSILRKFDPLPETLQTFHVVGADFNHVNKRGDSILAVAITHGMNAETIRELIHFAADPNGIDKQGNTPLHVVAKCDHHRGLPLRHRYSIIQHLLEIGSNPNTLNNRNETPFHAFLRNKGTDFKILRLFKSIYDERSLWTPTMATLVLEYAVGRNDDDFPDHDFEPLAQDCEAHGADFNWRDGVRNSLLHLAANTGKARRVKYLIEKGVDVNSITNMGMSSLQKAASSNKISCLEVIMCLIENGANLTGKTYYGKNILHHAALGTVDVLKYFLELGGVDVNGKDEFYGYSPLHCAVDDKKSTGINCLEKCRLLIQYGADVNIVDWGNCTPLQMAMMIPKKHKLLIKLLRESSINM